MYCLTNLCYVCLETKNNLISSVDSSVSVNKELLDMFGYCAHNLAWLKTKRIILICEECCSQLRETYQFLKMWHKNSAILQGYMDQLNTENEAEQLVHLKDIHPVKETQDVFVNIEDSLIIEEDIWKKEVTDDREEYPMDNNFTESMNNESNSEISVNSNTHMTITDGVISGFTCKQVPATSKKDSNTPASKPYTCSTCSKSFITKTSLKRHMRIHTSGKPFTCATCDKCFSQKSSFEYHMRTHTGEKPYQCATCEKYFRQHSHLTEHMRIHTSEKPYQCDRCEKCFSQQSNLVCHMRIHTGEKPYKCDRCDKCFYQKAHLVFHIRTHHGDKTDESL